MFQQRFLKLDICFLPGTLSFVLMNLIEAEVNTGDTFLFYIYDSIEKFSDFSFRIFQNCYIKEYLKESPILSTYIDINIKSVPSKRK